MWSLTEIFLVVAAVVVGIIVGWVIPIVVGIRNFRAKGYSPHWMWFGVHPLLGYIALIVSYAISPRQQCDACGGYIAINWKICPHCGGKSFSAPAGSGR